MPVAVRRARWLTPGNLISATRPRSVISADTIILTMPVPFVFAVVLRQLLDKAFGDIQRVTRQSRLQLVATRVTWVRGKTPAGPDAIKSLHIVDTCFYYPEDR